MRPPGVTAISLFFVFGALASGLSAISLLTPGGFLEPMWRVNPRGHAGLAAIGGWAVLLMVFVCIACVWAAAGLWRGRPSGWWVAAGMVGLNMIGDLVNGIVADARTLFGVPIALALLVYLASPRPRAFCGVDRRHAR